MLDKDKILALESCKDMTPEQIADLTTLSKNDEAQVIHDKTREWYNNWDKDIKAVFGGEKGATEKTFEYFKRMAGELVSEHTELKSKYDTLQAKADKGELTDAEKLKLKDLQTEITALKQTHETQLAELKKQIDTKNSEMENMYADMELSNSLSGIDYNEAMPTDVRDVFIKNKFEEIKSEYTREVVEENGKKRVQWRDKNGDIVRTTGKQEPATTADLILPKIASVLDNGKQTKGAGSKEPGKKGEKPGSYFVNDAKTQVEFTEKATEYLLKSGIEQGSKDFTAKMSELWKEHEVGKMPTLAR